MLSVLILSVLMLSAFILSVLMLSVLMLSVLMLSVLMMSVVMVNVVAPIEIILFAVIELVKVITKSKWPSNFCKDLSIHSQKSQLVVLTLQLPV